jgi:hypothetical protein
MSVGSSKKEAVGFEDQFNGFGEIGASLRQCCGLRIGPREFFDENSCSPEHLVYSEVFEIDIRILMSSLRISMRIARTPHIRTATKKPKISPPNIDGPRPPNAAAVAPPEITSRTAKNPFNVRIVPASSLFIVLSLRAL